MKYIEVRPETKEAIDKVIKTAGILGYLRQFHEGKLSMFKLGEYIEEVWTASGIGLDTAFFYLITGEYELKSNENWCVYVSNETFCITEEGTLYVNGKVKEGMTKEEAKELAYKLNKVVL